MVLFTGCSLLVAAPAVWADELEVVITGVDEPLLGNVRALVEPFSLTGSGRLTARRREAMRAKSELDAATALKPYGYYHARVNSSMNKTGDRAWRLDVKVDRGPPVLVASAEVDVTGPGALVQALREWAEDWPLTTGKVLVQPDWDAQKQKVLEIARDHGYLLADFTQQSLKVDLEKNEAYLNMIVATGRQAVMGEVRFDQDAVKPQVVNNLPRFQPGDPYDAWIMERFRIDVWQTGYFKTIEITEDVHLFEDPPRVDLDVRAEPRHRNTYQGTIGIGSDTGARVLFSWNRHLISQNGDSFSLGTGWQDHNDEFFVRGGYRLPRNVPTRQFWTADILLKRENEDLRVSDSLDDGVLYKLGNGDITDYSLRPGRLRVYNRERGYRQLFETIYAQYLHETIEYKLNTGDPQELSVLFEDGRDLSVDQDSKTLSFGIDYDMPYTRGQGFETIGQHSRAWAFISRETWGSDKDFAQAYLSSRWHFLAGDRWKFLLRGEVGYSDAEVRETTVIIEDKLVDLSVTQLPNLYRFKTGGSNSVRGYGFENLSNNNIGSNNVVTASVEAEMRILENWSLAAFFDVGNAFNDWGDMNLKTGWGLGVRWYTIAGAIRVDVAQGLDLPDKPWRIHFTIGTSLL